MPFWTAQHIGARKIARVTKILNEGGTLEEVSSVLGVSISRSSRIVHKLFNRVYVPKDGTIDAIIFESNSKKHEALEVDRQCEENLQRAKEYAETLSAVMDLPNGSGSLRKSQKVVTTGK